MATITIEDLVTLEALANMSADMATEDPDLAPEAAAFARVQRGLEAVLAAENQAALRDLLDMLADQKRDPVARPGAVRPRCVSCGDPIDVEFSDRCPDCAKLQASKADGYAAPSLSEAFPSVRCCAEPCVRGGRCENCGTWLADLPE